MCERQEVEGPGKITTPVRPRYAGKGDIISGDQEVREEAQKNILDQSKQESKTTHCDPKQTTNNIEIKALDTSKTVPTLQNNSQVMNLDFHYVPNTTGPVKISYVDAIVDGELRRQFIVTGNDWNKEKDGKIRFDVADQSGELRTVIIEKNRESIKVEVENCKNTGDQPDPRLLKSQIRSVREEDGIKRLDYSKVFSGDRINNKGVNISINEASIEHKKLKMMEFVKNDGYVVRYKTPEEINTKVPEFKITRDPQKKEGSFLISNNSFSTLKRELNPGAITFKPENLSPPLPRYTHADTLVEIEENKYQENNLEIAKKLNSYITTTTKINQDNNSNFQVQVRNRLADEQACGFEDLKIDCDAIYKKGSKKLAEKIKNDNFTQADIREHLKKNFDSFFAIKDKSPEGYKTYGDPKSREALLDVISGMVEEDLKNRLKQDKVYKDKKESYRAYANSVIDAVMAVNGTLKSISGEEVLVIETTKMEERVR